MIQQPTFTWRETGKGTITSTGLYTAPKFAGGIYTISARAGGVKGSTTLKIVTAPIITPPPT